MAELFASLQAALAQRYTIERELGRGGMAIVYLAQDLRHHRPVAIKVLKPEIAGALGPERFLQEIEIAAGLTHPHILPLHDSGEAAGFLYYVMPYVEGESLRDRLRRERQLPPDDARHIAREVADALSYAHSRHVIHRDVKPENILLGTGHAVVTDFGIARAITAAGGERLTETGITVGTPEYMSPEQTAGEAELDGRADVYSLGCVLYEMLVGKPPFAGPSLQAVVHQHLVAQPPRVAAIRPEVPPGVERAVQRALAKSPGERFATAADFAAALAPRDDRPPRNWPRVAQGVAVMVLAVVVVLGVRAALARGPVKASASSIAVIPFAPAVTDTGLARLGRELAITLSANLDGVGGIRTTDAMTVLAQVHDSNVSFSLKEGARLARRLGASSVVHGSLMRLQSKVRLDLGLFETDGLRPIARASVTASPEDLAALTDSATWAVLRQTWQKGEAPSPSLGAITTRSIPGLRAFLEGERLLAASKFAAAADAFGRAIEADSSFWLAYWRLAYTKAVWLAEPVDTTVRAAFVNHRSLFPPRDRLLIEAFLTESLSVAVARHRSLTEQFPGYWPGWWGYADLLIHQAPFTGTGYVESRAALERTLQLDPDLAEGWTHLMWVAARQRDTAASARALRELTRVWTAPGDATTDHAILSAKATIYPALAQLVRSAGAFDSATLAAVARVISSAPPQLDGPRMFGFNQAEIEMRYRVLQLKPPPDIAAVQWLALSLVWAARGAWDSALVAARRYANMSTSPGAALEGYRLAVVGNWLGAVEPAAVMHWRKAVDGSITDLTAERRTEVTWLDGLASTSRADFSGLAAARQALGNAGTRAGRMLDRSLAAFALDLAGQRKAATDALVRLEWEEAEQQWFRGDGCDHPFVPAVDRLMAARWLSAAGDLAQAARLLKWNEAIYPRPYCGADPFERMLSPLTSLEQGRVEDARGRAEAARVYYQEFLEQYDMPVAAHRHLVDDARRAVSRIVGEPPP